jgi:hypothetical protein
MTLLEALYTLRRDGPADATDGICYNLELIMSGELAFSRRCLLRQFMSWPEFSGNITYPVPLEGTKNPATVYWARQNHDKWVGEYGDARRRLLDHCITELENEQCTH